MHVFICRYYKTIVDDVQRKAYYYLNETKLRN